MIRLRYLLILAAASGAMAAAQTPNLSGTWKLNTTVSFFGGEHPANDYQLIKIIAAQGESIDITDIQVHANRVNIPLPDSKLQTELVPDGKERPGQAPPMFPGLPPLSFAVTTEWQGATLFIRRVGSSSSFATNSQMRYYLSADNSQLIELVESHFLFGDSAQRLVFDRTR